ncbi:MAG: aminopeptidase [Candidatus Thalassarchaeum betae]|uniref:Aminopeptidase n=1 Tax=Candidatus Thalassarchaeum betae TaxID=2599289 RepID=A0A2V3HRC5_9ARCH|nr:MAG: aminopeptidase [Candidatus Thalassoarchaea betae]PXF26432.1 MAG: aminopeptidase [Euryarchaeota archaeon]HIM13472.1 aminopeptidase [Candidatus Poseidoniales archaeon]HIM92364.1 aminopeptidase [Candidatus Poseidoniales archaeon]
MGKTVTRKQVVELRKEFAADPSNRVAQNAVTNVQLPDLTLNRDLVQDIDDSFSTKLDEWKVTAQMKSGRCWLFATLNLFRVGAMKKMNLKNFEFSQAHTHFWDKFERSNHLLEAIIDTAGRSVNDRTIHFLLSDPIGDGGQWNMAMNLIRKHGLVPMSAYPESNSSSATRWMNAELRNMLRSSACEIRAIIDGGGSVEEARAHKEKRMADIWNMLCIHLGTPPKTFNWQWRDKDGEFHRKGRMTPQQFAAEYVDIDWEDYVCIVNDPRNEYYRTYTVDFLQNVAGGPPVVYLNVPSKEMKAITQKLLEDGMPVWMGCDVGKEMDRKRGLWDAELFDVKGLYGVEYGMDKADRLRHNQTMMTHAMLFTGVDVVNGRPRRWRVENSWGDKTGQKGYYTMNDSWYDEYMFEIAAPTSYLSEKMLAGLETEPVVLPAWDPMGSLA